LIFGPGEAAAVLRDAGAARVHRCAEEGEPATGATFTGLADFFRRGTGDTVYGLVLFDSSSARWRSQGPLRAVLCRLGEAALRNDAVVAVLGAEGVRRVRWREEIRFGFFGPPSWRGRAWEWASAWWSSSWGNWTREDADPVLVSLLAQERLPPGLAYDVGCGTGANAFHLARQGWKVKGVDQSVRAIRAARRASRRQGPLRGELELIVGDVLDPASFPTPGDLVVDRGCFHCLQPVHRARYLERVYQALRPGGRVFLLTFAAEQAQARNVFTFSRPELEELFAPGFHPLRFLRAEYCGVADAAHVAWLERRDMGPDPRWVTAERSLQLGAGL
jgi:SAM-dependent methyltransferase